MKSRTAVVDLDSGSHGTYLLALLPVAGIVAMMAWPHSQKTSVAEGPATTTDEV